MREWKKIVLALLCVGVMFGVTACGNDLDDNLGGDDVTNEGDNVLEDAGDAAGDVIEDAGEDVGEGVENITDDLTEDGANGANSKE